MPATNTQNWVYNMKQTLSTLTEQYSEDEREELLGLVLEEGARQGGLVAMMKHQDDGSLPWSVEVVGTPEKGVRGIPGGDLCGTQCGGSCKKGSCGGLPGGHLRMGELCGLTGLEESVGALGVLGGEVVLPAGELTTLGGTVGAVAVPPASTLQKVLDQVMTGAVATVGAVVGAGDSLVAALASFLQQQVEGGGTKPPKLHPLVRQRKVDVGTLISRMRVSYNVLRAAASDAALRHLLIAELVQQSISEGSAIALPRGMRVHTLSPAEFGEFKESLSGLTLENLPEVQAKLMEMGLMGPPQVAVGAG